MRGRILPCQQQHWPGAVDALFVQPAFPSSQIGTGDPKRDVNRATGVRVSSSSFLEQQQHAAITSTHWAKACFIVQGFAGFQWLKPNIRR
jgi:hypothetical protein